MAEGCDKSESKKNLQRCYINGKAELFEGRGYTVKSIRLVPGGSQYTFLTREFGASSSRALLLPRAGR